jgi:hypothetical protein
MNNPTRPNATHTKSASLLQKTLAALQIIGALWTMVAGLMLFVRTIEATDRFTTNLMILAPFLLFLTMLGLLAGLLLWKNRPAGTATSLVYQLTQLVSFSSIPLSYYYAAPLFAWATLSNDNIGMTLGYGARFSLYFNQLQATSSIGLNLLTLFWIIYLLIRRTKTSRG